MPRCLILLLILGAMTTAAATARGFEGILEMSAGYDDNPARSDSAQGSGFVRYRAASGHRFSLGKSQLELFGDGEYGQYSDVEDRHQLGAGLSLERRFLRNRLLARTAITGLLYRDDLNQEDERDQTGLTLALSWIAHARWTLALEADISQAWYVTPVASVRRHGNCNGAGPGKAGCQGGSQGEGQGDRAGESPCRFQPADREDRIVNLKGIADYYPHPDIRFRVTIEYEDLCASVDKESYQRLGLGLSGAWVWGQNWELRGELGWSRAVFDPIPGERRRKDDLWRMGAELGYYFNDRLALFLEYQWGENDSQWEEESYIQRISRCGLVWWF